MNDSQKRTPAPARDVVRLGAYLPRPLARRVRVAAAASDRSISDVVREAVEAHLEREGRAA